MITWDYIAGVATTITILSAIWSVHRAFRARQKKLKVYWNRKVLIPELLYQDFTITVRGEDGNEGGRLIRDFILITNNTVVNISDQDLLYAPFIPLDEQGTLFKLKLVPYLNAGTFTPYEDLNGIALNNLVIPRQSGVMFELYHDGSFQPTLSLQPRTLNDPEFSKVYNESSARNHGFMTAVILALIGVSTVAFITIFLFILRRFDLMPTEPGLAALLLVLSFPASMIGVIVLDARYRIADRMERWFARKMGRPLIFEDYIERVRQNRLFYDGSRTAAGEARAKDGVVPPSS